MNLALLIIALVQITVSLVVGIFLIYFASKVFQSLTRGIKDIEELKQNNIAVAILNAAIVLSLIIVVRNSVDSSITVFANTLRNPSAIFTDYIEMSLIMIGQIVLSSIIAFSAIYIGLKIFMRLTKDLDELLEIKNNNVAVSILLSVILVSLSLLLQPGIIALLDALIPFPSVSLINIGN
jgi:uncharacterized membrane protein YjfL (UPF0719 family)